METKFETAPYDHDLITLTAAEAPEFIDALNRVRDELTTLPAPGALQPGTRVPQLVAEVFATLPAIAAQRGRIEAELGKDRAGVVDRIVTLGLALCRAEVEVDASSAVLSLDRATLEPVVRDSLIVVESAISGLVRRKHISRREVPVRRGRSFERECFYLIDLCELLRGEWAGIWDAVSLTRGDLDRAESRAWKALGVSNRASAEAIDLRNRAYTALLRALAEARSTVLALGLPGNDSMTYAPSPDTKPRLRLLRGAPLLPRAGRATA